MKDLVNQSTILSYLIRYRFTTDTAPKIICIHIKIGNHIHRTVKAAVFLMAEHNLSIGKNYHQFLIFCIESHIQNISHALSIFASLKEILSTPIFSTSGICKPRRSSPE